MTYPEVLELLKQIDVLQTQLTGYVLGSNTPITSSNTILTAFGNIQAQINTKGTGTLNTAIKSRQSGSFDAADMFVTINYSTIDPNKSIILVWGGATGGIWTGTQNTIVPLPIGARYIYSTSAIISVQPGIALQSPTQIVGTWILLEYY